jgi:hypothetical protein
MTTCLFAPTRLKDSSSVLEIRTAVLSWDQCQYSVRSIPCPPVPMHSKRSSTMTRSRRKHHLQFHASHASNLGSYTGICTEHQSTTRRTKRSTTQVSGPHWSSIKEPGKDSERHTDEFMPLESGSPWSRAYVLPKRIHGHQYAMQPGERSGLRRGALL